MNHGLKPIAMANIVELEAVRQNEQADFDPLMFRLAALCKKKHEYRDTGMSLRYHPRTARGQCVVCRKLSQFKDRQKNAQSILERNRRYRAANAQKVASYQKGYREAHADEKYEYNKRYVEEHREQVNANRRVYRHNNREKVDGWMKDFFERNPGAKEVGNRKTQAKSLGLHSAPYTAADLNLHRQQFNNRCALCGSKKALNMNYVIPKSKGGSNTLSNLIFACLSCCCSRKSRDLDEWYPAQPFYSQRRWNRIMKLLGKNASTLSQLPLF